MQTRIYRKKFVNGSVNSEGHLKKIKKKQARRLFRPRSIHLCHQKPNPARETVPLYGFPQAFFISKEASTAEWGKEKEERERGLHMWSANSCKATSTPPPPPHPDAITEAAAQKFSSDAEISTSALVPAYIMRRMNFTIPPNFSA
jgi:hypothetical protein